MRRGTLPFKLAAVVLLTAGVLIVLGSAPPDTGVARGGISSFYVVRGPTAKAHGRSPVPLVLDGLAGRRAPRETGKLSWHLSQLAQAGRQAQAQGQAITGRTLSFLPKNLQDLVAAGLMRITTSGEVVVELTLDGPSREVASSLAGLRVIVERERAVLGPLKVRVPIARLEEAAPRPGCARYVFPATGSPWQAPLPPRGNPS